MQSTSTLFNLESAIADQQELLTEFLPLLTAINKVKGLDGTILEDHLLYMTNRALEDIDKDHGAIDALGQQAYDGGVAERDLNTGKDSMPLWEYRNNLPDPSLRKTYIFNYLRGRASNFVESLTTKPLPAKTLLARSIEAVGVVLTAGIFVITGLVIHNMLTKGTLW